MPCSIPNGVWFWGWITPALALISKISIKLVSPGLGLESLPQEEWRGNHVPAFYVLEKNGRASSFPASQAFPGSRTSPPLFCLPWWRRWSETEWPIRSPHSLIDGLWGSLREASVHHSSHQSLCDAVRESSNRTEAHPARTGRCICGRQILV